MPSKNKCVAGWRTTPTSLTITNAEALPAKIDKTVRKERDEYTQEVMDCIEQQLSKGRLAASIRMNVKSG